MKSIEPWCLDMGVFYSGLMFVCVFVYGSGAT